MPQDAAVQEAKREAKREAKEAAKQVFTNVLKRVGQSGTAITGAPVDEAFDDETGDGLGNFLKAAVEGQVVSTRMRCVVLLMLHLTRLETSLVVLLLSMTKTDAANNAVIGATEKATVRPSLPCA